MTPADAARRTGIELARSGRFDLAEPELRRALALDPESPELHSTLSITLSNLGRPAEGLEEADQAVALAPDNDYAHYARAVALLDLGRSTKATDAAREAIRLNPDSVSARVKLAGALLSRNDFQQALDEVDRALALDPEYADALSVRAVVLSHLGRHPEATSAIRSALALEPGNFWFHANRGWTLLRAGREREALDAFRESLRLEPGFERARLGILEAMKARNVAYRWLLRYGHWMERTPILRRWALLLAGFVVAMTFAPAFGIYFGLLLMGWVGEPLYNLVLLADPFGRMVLTRDETVGALAVATCLWGGVLVIAGGLVAGGPTAPLAGGVLASMSLPVSAVARLRPGSRRRLIVATAGLAAVGATFVGLTATESRAAPVFGGFYIVGLLLSALVVSALKR